MGAEVFKNARRRVVGHATRICLYCEKEEYCWIRQLFTDRSLTRLRRCYLWRDRISERKKLCVIVTVLSSVKRRAKNSTTGP